VDYVLPVPVHKLATTEAYLPVLDGHSAKFPAGQRFAYCNSGYVVLALLAEPVAGRPFDELVDQRVCAPAGMADTASCAPMSCPATPQWATSARRASPMPACRSAARTSLLRTSPTR
jgi:CubicO group peptidase (beta-lactamase class C family)